MKKFIRYFIAVALVGLMFFVSDYLKIIDVVFPEVAALSVVLLVIDKGVWKANYLQIFLLFAIYSCLGVVVVKFSPFSTITNFIISAFFALLGFQLTRTNIYPAFSAMLLAILLGVHSWIYPISVILMISLILGLQTLMVKWGLRAELNSKELSSRRKSGARWIISRWIVISLCAFLAIHYDLKFLILPPIIVSYLEVSTTKSDLKSYPFNLIILMAAGSVLGMFSKMALVDALGFPPYIAFPLCLSVLFLFFEYVRRSFAPAAALVLIPYIIEGDLTFYPIYVVVGSIIFILIGEIQSKYSKSLLS